MEWKVTAKGKLRWAQSHQLANLQCREGCYKNHIWHQTLLSLCLAQTHDFIHKSNTWQFLKYLSLKLHTYNIFLQLRLLQWTCLGDTVTASLAFVQLVSDKCLGTKRLTTQCAVLSCSIQPLATAVLHWHLSCNDTSCQSWTPFYVYFKSKPAFLFKELLQSNPLLPIRVHTTYIFHLWQLFLHGWFIQKLSQNSNALQSRRELANSLRSGSKSTK